MHTGMWGECGAGERNRLPVWQTAREAVLPVRCQCHIPVKSETTHSTHQCHCRAVTLALFAKLLGHFRVSWVGETGLGRDFAVMARLWRRTFCWQGNGASTGTETTTGSGMMSLRPAAVASTADRDDPQLGRQHQPRYASDVWAPLSSHSGSPRPSGALPLPVATSSLRALRLPPQSTSSYPGPGRIVPLDSEGLLEDVENRDRLPVVDSELQVGVATRAY